MPWWPIDLDAWFAVVWGHSRNWRRPMVFLLFLFQNSPIYFFLPISWPLIAYLMNILHGFTLSTDIMISITPTNFFSQLQASIYICLHLCILTSIVVSISSSDILTRNWIQMFFFQLCLVMSLLIRCIILHHFYTMGVVWWLSWGRVNGRLLLRVSRLYTRLFYLPLRTIVHWVTWPGKGERTGTSRSLYNLFIGFAIEVCVIGNIFVYHPSKK